MYFLTKRSHFPIIAEQPAHLVIILLRTIMISIEQVSISNDNNVMSASKCKRKKAISPLRFHVTQGT